MYSAEEKQFLDYWSRRRTQKKKYLLQMAVGLPLGVIIVIAIFITTFSGWYKRAGMEFNKDASIIPVLLIAAILIVVFIVIFSGRLKWDQNEQRYQELISREKKV
jgi:uncharacterized membrane protein